MNPTTPKKKEVRREQILHGAQRVFATMGYHAAGVADILEETGIARGTFYMYFDSKRAVFDELFDNLTDRLRETIVDVDLTDPHRTLFQQLQDNLERLFSLLFQERSLARILLTEAVSVDPSLNRKLEGFYDDLLKLTSETLALGQGAGIVRPCDTWVAANCVIGSLKEVVYQHILRDLPTPDVRLLATEILAYNVQGVLTPPRQH